jgi:hypothetical protein
MSTRQTEIARLEATSFRSQCREFSRLGHKSLGLGMTRTNDWEFIADLVFVLHLI